MSNDLFENSLFQNTELTAELLFAALDLEDLVRGIPSRLVRKQLRDYADKVESKVATIFRSNKSSMSLDKKREVNTKLHYKIESNINELNERIENNLSDIMEKAHDSLRWVPENVFVNFTMITAKAIQYLFTVLPKKPSRSLFGIPSSKYKYADFEVSRFNRIYIVIEDPMSVLDDLKNNRINLESIETMEIVYPEILNHMRMELTQYFIEKKEKQDDFDISYQQKINLAKFFNTSVSEFLDPDYVNKLQTILKLSAQEGEGSAQGKTAKSEQAQVPSSGIKQRLSEG